MFDNIELTTLLTVLEEGSFDAAARRQNVSPGAISQRIKNLEERVGQILVRRLVPPEPTEAGKVLLRMAHQVRLLNTDTIARLGHADHSIGTRLTIAISDGSLASWFLPAMATFLKDHNIMLDLRVGDHVQTNQMLRDGTAIAAVTSTPMPIQGCRSERLGEFLMIAIAEPQFADCYFKNGMTLEALSRAPIVLCDRDDRWTERFIVRLAGKPVVPPTHYVPTSRGAIEAVMMGFGWRAASTLTAGNDVAAGRLVNLAPNEKLAMDVHWQTFRIKSATLDALTAAVRACAAERLS